jgi:hypothetical protein
MIFKMNTYDLIVRIQNYSNGNIKVLTRSTTLGIGTILRTILLTSPNPACSQPARQKDRASHSPSTSSYQSSLGRGCASRRGCRLGGNRNTHNHLEVSLRAVTSNISI